MRLALVAAVIFAILPAAAQRPPQAKVEQKEKLESQKKGDESAANLADFKARIDEYMKLRKKAEADLPSLKPTGAPEVLNARKAELAAKPRAARSGAKPGEIFTPAITGEFRRLIAGAMRGSKAGDIRTSLKRGEPVALKLGVNDAYPENIPLQSTPPTLLLNLPALPKELDYRIVGQDLVLRDVEANLIIDYLPKAIA